MNLNLKYSSQPSYFVGMATVLNFINSYKFLRFFSICMKYLEIEHRMIIQINIIENVFVRDKKFAKFIVKFVKLLRV